jgi:hypothetical protein
MTVSEVFFYVYVFDLKLLATVSIDDEMGQLSPIRFSPKVAITQDEFDGPDILLGAGLIQSDTTRKIGSTNISIPLGL